MSAPSQQRLSGQRLHPLHIAFVLQKYAFPLGSAADALYHKASSALHLFGDTPSLPLSNPSKIAFFQH